MAWKSSVTPRSRGWVAGVRSLLGVLLALGAGGAACSDDEGDDAAACEGGGGPVTSNVRDTHCIDDGGREIVQSIGACVSEADAADLAEPGEEEEELGIFYGQAADDDDCKYRVSFTNTCIKLNEPVTFTVSLERKADGSVASGALPMNPEVYMEEDGHPSPSNNIRAPESPAGTYAIGPIEFDRPGRWVVRFHFFEMCSDLPEDAPHGHVAFYIDVP